MAKFGSDKVAFLLVDGYSVLGSTTDLTDNVEAMLEDTHPLGADWVQQEYVGLKSATLTQDGFYEDEEDAVHDALIGHEGQRRVISYGVEGNAVGSRAVSWEGAAQVNYHRVASRGELHKANASYQVAGAVEDVVILHPLVAESGNGNTEGVAVDNGAQTTDGAVLYLQVSALDLDGLVGVQITVRDSADGSSWADLESFSVVPDAPYAERIVVDGTVRRYLAVTWDYGGITTEEPTATFMVAAHRA